MGRGVPKNGFRNTLKRQMNGITPEMLAQLTSVGGTSAAIPVTPAAEAPTETDEQIEAKLEERFGILEMLTKGATAGSIRAFIVSGPPGLGKSFTVEKELAIWDPTQAFHTITKGYVKATGLYRLLWAHRRKGQVLIFDDADSIFYDDVSLNMLKSAADTTDDRYVSYLAEYDMWDDGEKVTIPRRFLFEGTIIFLSNLDFTKTIEKGHKMSPHLKAMMSRSHFVDLEMKTLRDYLIRIRMVVREGLLSRKGLTAEQEAEVMEFVEENWDKLREHDLRTVLKIADARKMSLGGSDWRRFARVTVCRNA